MDAKTDVDLEAFRQEARDWIAQNFPASLKGQPASASALEEPETDPTRLAWKKTMGEKGWGVPTWPAKYGGGGLDPARAKIVVEELARAGAYNPIGGMGVMMFGPTLLEYGTEAQKQRHIPGIVTGEVWWCQGFSEPGAGSDLASLSTRAEDKGDHFLVNGQKIWTSGAQHADWCFALVRTDTTRKHAGISFIVFDMKTPGVRVQPIRLISGDSPFCETFLTDVKVPKENLIGPLNDGWNIGKRLLQHERSGIAGGGRPGPTVSQVAVKRLGRDAEGRLVDEDLRARIASHEMEAKAFALTAARATAESRSNAGPSAASSIMKNVGTRVGQARAELTLEILGVQGLGWDGDDFTPEELAVVRGWLGGKATTIYGGSQEVQNNIVAKRILGLPDSTPSA